jgi:tetratricopeptide (TPR) repeat protein
VALGLATAAEERTKIEVASGPATTEERKEAERHLGKARILVKRKMKEKAVAAAENAVSADPSYVDAQVFLGTLLLDLSDENADKAQAYFEKALKLAPRNVDAKVGVARVKSLQGDTDGAVSILEDAVRLNPKPEKIYYELGLVHERAQQYQEAVEAYRKALERLLK